MNDLTPLRPAALTTSLPNKPFVLVHVDFPKPGEHMRPGATLNGKGWVIADSDIVEITIYSDEIFLCYAFYGLPRPEVAEKFSHYPQAEQSGFSFSAKLGSSRADSEHRTIVVKVQTTDGAVTRKIIPVAIQEETETEPAGALAVGAASFELRPISIFVEHARVDGRGVLRVSGWIASLAPLVGVCVFLAEQQLGTPELGMPRPDVAANHPNYPNAAASGFELVQDISALQSSRCVLRITALCAGGIRRQVIMPIENSASQQLITVQDSDIHVCCDSFSIRADGLVSVGGWAVANAGVRGVSVALERQEIGEAQIGLSRPDVGNRFPRISSARQSGFKFARRLEQELQGEHLLTVTVRTCEGGEKQVQLPLHVAQAEGDELEIGDVLGNVDDLRFEIDRPRLNADRVAEPLRGALTVSGWAVAQGGLDAVEVRLGERSPVAAYLGIRREDVAANFPDNQEALFSGFAVTVPHRVIGEGEHTVRVLIRAKSGRSLERAFRLISEKPDENRVGMIRSRLSQAEIDLRNAVLGEMCHHPLFLVLLRARGLSSTDVQQIRITVETLSRQAYPNWLAVVSLPHGCRRTLTATAIVDDPKLVDRVRVQGSQRRDLLTWPDTPGPAFVVILSAGDRLGADALLELAVASGLDSSEEFIYSDERCYDPVAGAVQPRLKPDWSPETLLSTNYIGRVWCAARALVERARISLEEFALRGEYDAVLRLTEEARAIGHVPLVLCERAEARLDSPRAERIALECAVARCGFKAEVLPGRTADSWRVRRVVETTGLVSLIIPTCATRGLIETTIRSIREGTTYPHIEIVCTDNIPAEEQGWKTWLRQNADQVIDIPGAFNWSRFSNLGAAAARGEFLLFLNDDIEVRDPAWLHAMLEHAQHPEVGVVGPQLLYPDGKVQHAGMFLSGRIGRHAFRFAAADEPGLFGWALTTRNVLAVTGACMLMRRSTFEAVGRFDEAHMVINNDLDFCLRTWKSGLRVVWTPFAKLLHHELASRAKMGDDFDTERFHSMWRTRFAEGDPFFNPGLTPDSDDYLPDSEPTEILYSGHPLLARERVRRILALKLDHIGDFVTAFPVLRRLKQHFPGAELTVLAAKASLSLAALEPAIDRCIEFNFFHARSELGRNQLSETELRELQAKLKPYRFNLAIDLRMQTDTRYVLRYAGAELLAGFDYGGRFPWLDVAVEWEGDMHLLPKRVQASDKLMMLADAVNVACETERAVVQFIPMNEARSRLLALPVAQDVSPRFFEKPLVCIHPGAGNVMKQWPIDSYAELADLLVAEEDVHIVLVGGPDDVALGGQIEGVIKPAALLSLIGRLDLAHLPAVLQACVLFIGNDSGPKHIAAALGIPTVGVHPSNVDAAEWRPFGLNAVAIRRKVICGPCYLSSPTDCHRNLACLTGIQPREVYRACRQLLRLRSALVN